MKSKLLLLTFPMVLYAGKDDQIILRQQQKDLNQCIDIFDSKKFNEKFNEKSTKDVSNSKFKFFNLNFDKFKSPFLNSSWLKYLLPFNSEKPEITKEEIIKDLQDKISAKKVKLINDQDDPHFFKNLRSSSYYFCATFAFFGMGMLSKEGTLKDGDCSYFQSLIFEYCLGFNSSSIFIHLKPNFKTTVTLFGLSAFSAYYGLQDVYKGIFANSILEEKLQETKKIEKIIENYKKNK